MLLGVGWMWVKNKISWYEQKRRWNWIKKLILYAHLRKSIISTRRRRSRALFVLHFHCSLLPLVNIAILKLLYFSMREKRNLLQLQHTAVEVASKRQKKELSTEQWKVQRCTILVVQCHGIEKLLIEMHYSYMKLNRNEISIMLYINLYRLLSAFLLATVCTYIAFFSCYSYMQPYTRGF